MAKKGTEALVVVHLSSLDALAEQQGVDTASDLAERLGRAVLSHKGPVVVVDQRWPWAGEISRPRFDLVRGIELQRDIRWTHFREDRQEWRSFLKDLSDDLEAMGVDEVVLGGVWYSPRGVGCVADAERALKGRFSVRVHPGLVGCVAVPR